ncbi:hypothetical protein AOC36_02540 [Erysipelothrix larvae]|uniref:Glycosyl transferase n=1 Tax=Erysipelothrix larvae TaxID=1514105 RepID=A0A0X8GYT9_9FIRM|nr:glycosyltransferase [Erysipelothrix larvae]AMC92900.1 hypothetical protein AOC36_02540 [Erysipelothrix larvae]
MRIAYINTVLDYGSTGGLVRACAEDMKQKGHEVLMCYGRYDCKSKEDTFFFGNKLSTWMHFAMTLLFGRHGLHSSFQTRKLLKRLDAFQPDVVHLHNIHGFYLNIEMLFKYLKKKNIRIVWTLHDCWSVSGSSAHFDYDGCEKWDEGCVVCKNTHVYPRVYGFKRQEKNFALKKRLFTSIDIDKMTIVTPSHWLEDLIKTTFLNRYHIVTIYNGISLSRFEAKKVQPALDTVELLGVANVWNKRKGFDDFLELAKMLPKHYHLTLIGLNEKQKDSCPSNVKGILRTSDFHELVKIYQAAHIYLNLSYEETMGLTTVEALACGTPCIVYDKTAVPEVIDTSCGIVCEAGNLSALKSTIESFDFKQFTGDKCVKRAKLFESAIMLAQYSQVLGANHGTN